MAPARCGSVRASRPSRLAYRRVDGGPVRSSPDAVSTRVLRESKAWAMYRERRKQFASLIGDREPIVLKRQLPGMGRAMRYIITIADDDRRPLQNLCRKLSATDVACDVMRNKFGPG